MIHLKGYVADINVQFYTNIMINKFWEVLSIIFFLIYQINNQIIFIHKKIIMKNLILFKLFISFLFIIKNVKNYFNFNMLSHKYKVKNNIILLNIYVIFNKY
jgi:hypothetical protein